MRLSYFIVLFAFLAACSTYVAAPSLTPLVPAEGVKTKSISFERIRFKIKRGQVVGVRKHGLLCAPDMRTGSEVRWRSGSVDIERDQFNTIFRDVLTEHNYQVKGNPDALFEDTRERDAEIRVAALVTGFTWNYCYPRRAWGDLSTSNGDAHIKVTWKVFSRLDNSVVRTVKTEGSAQVTEWRANGAEDVLYDAFAHAAQNFLADQKFYEIVTYGKGKRVTSKKKLKPISVRGASPYKDKIAKNINLITNSVVTVDMGGSHGSGFIISKQGHFLTNHHVVGTAKFVVIRLASGEELTAEILRRDKVRDIAFGKIQGSGVWTPMPIVKKIPSVGHDVYAMGAPLEEDLQSTLSKGIVSAYRKNKQTGVPLIQADVDIHGGNSGGPLMNEQGNVVGVSVSGIAIGDRKMSSGLNFFIPIGDALRKLAVTVK